MGSGLVRERSGIAEVEVEVEATLVEEEEGEAGAKEGERGW